MRVGAAAAGREARAEHVGVSRSSEVSFHPGGVRHASGVLADRHRGFCGRRPRSSGPPTGDDEFRDGLREGPSFIAFARENGSVYHTYTVMAPDPFVAPYHSFLLERTPKTQPQESRAWRKDEYPS